MTWIVLATRRGPTASQFRGSCAGCWTSWIVLFSSSSAVIRGPSRQSPS
ncbi:unnamed protein product [Scytosiphon promiscuus]